MIFSVLLNPAIDVVYEVNDLIPGSTITDLDATAHPAGKGINVARVTKALGEETCVVGAMPENDRARFCSHLDKLSIAHALLPIGGNVRINATISDRESQMITHLNCKSSRLAQEAAEEFFAYAETLMRPSDYWVLSGSLPQGMDDAIYQRLIRSLKERGITVLLDTRDAPLSLGLRAKPSMVKPNHSELEGFFDERIDGIHHIALKGKRLIDMGIDYVFVSLGGDGMIAIHENDCLLCSPPGVEVVDTVGCGDALVAGLIVGHVRSLSFNEMCRLGVACGVSNASRRGPGAVCLEEVYGLAEKVGIEAV